MLKELRRRKIMVTENAVTENIMRLNKFLAYAGIASRRAADEMIRTGLVRVNGKIIFELGMKIDTIRDKVTVKHKPVFMAQKPVYFMFNKPLQVLSSMSDPEGRPCVAEFFERVKERVFPVGRLDWDSEGLLLLTNDGNFSQSILHPSKEIPKTYHVKIDGHASDERLKKLLLGVSIPGGRVKALVAEKIIKGKDKYDWVKIVITEGKNRQVRHMLSKVGYDVKKLQRVAIGALRLGTLKKGQFKQLTSDDIKKVFITPETVKIRRPINTAPAVKRPTKKQYFKKLKREEYSN